MANLPVEFTINVTGEITGETFRGVFKVKPRLSHRDTLLQDQMRRDLLGPKPGEAGQSAVASALVFSKIWAHLSEAPNWWKDASNGVDLLDEAPVVAVYDAVQKAEKEAVDAVKKAGEKAAEELKAKETK
jgi:hypothetical protein